MNDLHRNVKPPQTYLLSKEGYDELKSIQAMLSLMAQIAYNDEDKANGITGLVVSCAELHRIFSKLSSHINVVLETVQGETRAADDCTRQ